MIRIFPRKHKGL